MELKKANLHMDRMKCQLNTQITLEEDKNISDRCPDAYGILMDHAKIDIEEIRPMTDYVLLRGKLLYEILCKSDMPEKRLYRQMGEIPWEEKIRVEGMESMDQPQVVAALEDMKIGLINSRKINVRALINFCIQQKELYDEEILTDIVETQKLEIKKENLQASVLVIDKKDVFRIKEDLELPSVLPPIREVLYKTLDLGKVEVKILEDTIGLQGEIKLFLLYESEGEGAKLKAYETTIPFSGNVECQGCSNHMVGDIMPVVSYQNISVKEDYDGEDRMLELEMVLDIPMQIYENRNVEQITDIYGVSQEVILEYTNQIFKRIAEPIKSRCKITQEIKTKSTDKKILQISHIHCIPFVEEARWKEDQFEVEGMLQVSVLYLEDGEEESYGSVKKAIPFCCPLENVTGSPKSRFKIRPTVEQLDGVILDEYSMELKVVLGLEILVEDCFTEKKISDVIMKPYAKEIQDKKAGIAVYVPGKKESLWEIGKRYGISLDTITKVNDWMEYAPGELSEKEVEAGQKLLLIREEV